MKTHKCNSNFHHMASENITDNVDLDLNPNFKIRKEIKKAHSMKYKPKYTLTMLIAQTRQTLNTRTLQRRHFYIYLF